MTVVMDEIRMIANPPIGAVLPWTWMVGYVIPCAFRLVSVTHVALLALQTTHFGHTLHYNLSVVQNLNLGGAHGKILVDRGSWWRSSFQEICVS